MRIIIKKIWNHHKTTGETLFESILEVKKKLDLDVNEIALIVKNDKTLMGALEEECKKLNMVQREKVTSNLIGIF